MSNIGETFDLSSFFGSCWTFKTSAINRSAISPCFKNQRRLLYQGFEVMSTGKVTFRGFGGVVCGFSGGMRQEGSLIALVWGQMYGKFWTKKAVLSCKNQCYLGVDY